MSIVEGDVNKEMQTWVKMTKDVIVQADHAQKRKVSKQPFDRGGEKGSYFHQPFT